MKRFYILIIILVVVHIANAQSYSIGDNVQVTENGVNLRSSAAGTVVATASSGDKGSITAGPTYATLNGTPYYWYKVLWSSGTNTGTSSWIVQNFLTKITSTPCDILVQGTPTISPNPVQAGNSILVSYTIKNQGGSTAAASQTKIQIKNSS